MSTFQLILVWAPETGKSEEAKSTVQTENFQIGLSECKWIRMEKTGTDLEENT